MASHYAAHDRQAAGGGLTSAAMQAEYAELKVRGKVGRLGLGLWWGCDYHPKLNQTHCKRARRGVVECVW